MNRRILIADDQQHILDSLSLFLEGEDFTIVTAQSPQQVKQLLEQQTFDLLLIDMNYTQDTTSGKEGIQLIETIRQLDEIIPIIVMTAWASIELSVDAIRNGANDFIEKPWKNNRLLSLINNQLSLAEQRRTNQRLTELTKDQLSLSDMVAESRSMQPVLDLIERTAGSDANILLTGESGVGKSLIAGLIHSASERHDKPLVTLNMGALSDSLFESELFGHQKGAFTDAKANRMGRFEMADNGSLFMDEIANIPMSLQGKLLRVLESGEFESLGSSRTKKVDVRIISASNVNFNDEIAEGRFRQDLLYRLNTITIEIPPLRQRQEDIVPLANRFLMQFSKKYRRDDLQFSEFAIKALIAHNWPGNVRELSHCIERAVLMAKEQQIMAEDLGVTAQPVVNNLTDLTLEQAERMLISQAMEQYQGNVAQAAEKLGISRAALYRRLEKYEDIAVVE